MKQFFVIKSKIHGYGIAAGENIKRGEIITRLKGKLKFKINKSIEDALANPDWVGVDKNIWIDPDKPYKFLNHSCDANSGIQGRLKLIAVKDIKEGEEITIDYSTIEGDQRWKMSCDCGAENCRHEIRSIHDLSKEDFERYMPYISTYFKRVYQKRFKNA